jgi:hypothetical protein
MDKLPPELKEKIKKETKALLADEGKFKKIFEGSFDKISGGKNEIKREQLPDLMKEISKAVGKPEPSQHEIDKYMSEAKDAVIDKEKLLKNAKERTEKIANM